ncbi:DUF2190 domain-containing protein [Corynebacterium sp. S7]
MYQDQMKDRFNPGTDLTAVATGTITGSTFVAIAGPLKNDLINVATATAGTHAAGVAKYTAVDGDLVGVARGSSRVVTVTAGSVLTPGDLVEVGAGGMAVKHTTGTVVGYAVDNAAANEPALISLNN